MADTNAATSSDFREGLALGEDELNALFGCARTPTTWSTRPVDHSTLISLYDLLKMGPTSGNTMPGRFLFLETRESREKVKAALSSGNVERFIEAPVVALVCHDPLFFENLPRLNNEANLREWFASDVGLSDETAFRNGTLQGAYLIMAARALGLSAAPMSGFDCYAVEEILLAELGWRANFMVGLGFPGEAPLTPRAYRLSFDEACKCI